MGYPDTFEGFQVNSKETWSDFHKQSFQPKKFEDHDLDILIDACGVCGSDVHTITGGWGPAEYPLTVGHEIIGKVIKAGPKVTTVQVGDRVGVGAQIWACLQCQQCKSDNENYCPHQVDTYNAPYPDGTIAQGGYSSHVRAHEYFTFKIPDNIPTHQAAPMLCAGLTTFSPLYRAGTGPGKKIAIIGLGGLGHFATIWAHHLGAEVFVLSHSPEKEKDAITLGADHFIDTTQKDWQKPYAFTFDYMLNCADMTHKFDLASYMSCLKVNKTFNNVGIPDASFPELKFFDFAPNGAHFSASHIGSRPEMQAMLKLASEKRVQPFIETIPISEKGCKEAVNRVKVNDVHYRFTLTDFDKAFPEYHKA